MQKAAKFYHVCVKALDTKDEEDIYHSITGIWISQPAMGKIILSCETYRNRVT